MNFLNVLSFLCVLILSDALLYDKNDNLVNFDEKSFKLNFNDILQDNWFIEFYHSMCGHCINFAPKFKQVMQDAKYWKEIVKFGVVDCSVEKSLCKSQKIKYYPTFKVFYRNLPVISNHEVVSIRRNTIDNIFGDLIEIIEKKFKSPIIREHGKINNQINIPYLFLTGEHLIDLKRIFLTYHGRLEYDIYYQKSAMSGFKLKLVTKNTLKPKRFSNLKNLYQELNSYLIEDSQLDPNITEEISLIRNSSNSINSKDSPVYNQDIFASIMYAFINDVTDAKLVKIEDYKILRDFIIQLYHFSGLNDKIKGSFAFLISSLGDKIRSLTKRQKFSKSWLKMLESSKLPMYEIPWIGCIGSQPYLRKYPCGLWTTFHVLTVNQYIESKKNKSTTGNSSKLFNDIREFIKTFFSCRECAENFQKETLDFENNTETSRDLVLYLWAVHNNVNRRLKNQPSDDPKFPKVAFPPFSICPKCRRSFSEEWPESKNWIENNVLKYLVKEYSKNIVPLKGKKL